MGQLGNGIVSIHGQKLSPWVSTHGWVARSTEMRSDGMLAQSFLQVDRVVCFFFPCGVGGRSTDGVYQLVQEMRRVPA